MHQNLSDILNITFLIKCGQSKQNRQDIS